eukprot:4617528-Prymnesium_polylepis.1
MREGSVGGLRRCHDRSQGRRVDFGQWVNIVLCGWRAICVLRSVEFARVLCGCGACDALWGGALQ